MWRLRWWLDALGGGWLCCVERTREEEEESFCCRWQLVWPPSLLNLSFALYDSIDPSSAPLDKITVLLYTCLWRFILLVTFSWVPLQLPSNMWLAPLWHQPAIYNQIRIRWTRSLFRFSGHPLFSSPVVLPSIFPHTLPLSALRPSSYKCDVTCTESRLDVSIQPASLKWANVSVWEKFWREEKFYMTHTSVLLRDQ